MCNMVHYQGIFFEGESLQKILEQEQTHLERKNDEIHCTFQYKPPVEDLLEELINKEFSVKLIGYACDGKNSGFEVELPKELIPYYKNVEEKTNRLKIPHITVSISKDAKSKDTKDLKFMPLDKKIEIVGKFGYWIQENGKEYLSYQKQII
mgnify:CR=1 FL=1